MAQWYYNCKKCGKVIKRKESKNLICLSCRRESKIKNCLYCGKPFYPQKSIRKYCSKSCSSKHTLSGRTLIKTHRENLSKSAGLKSPGFTKCKFYSVFNPFVKKNLKVQGTYELKYANYLNNNNIKWNRGKKINIPYYYKDINRTYYPDFYLIDTDEYIETKGYMFDEDKEKMSAVISQNRDKNIKILFKKDLIKLGIDF